jgi:SAM-dependent methyltransferase
VSLLDVGCGTGEHLKFLGRFERAGLDNNPEFVTLAQQKLPDVSICLGEMTNFGLNRRFDVVTCLFSAIGYLPDDASILAFLNRCKRHLTAKGILLVEPWFEPDPLGAPKRIGMGMAEQGDRKVCRIMVTSVEGDFSVMSAHHLIVEHGEVDYFIEHHRMRLISRNKLTELFRQAGFKVTYDAKGLTGRGLYIARRRGSVGPGVPAQT